MKLGRHPVIIGGCGRSGTTLLLSILSCHPHLYGINEETRAFCPTGYKVDPTPESPFKLKKLYDYLLQHTIPPAARRWCEKTPKNVLSYPRILHYYGSRVRIINMVRDGRDVITSHHPSNPEIFWIRPERWVNDVKAGKRFAEHPQVKTLRYEDLITDYEATIRSLCSFIGEEFDEDFLAYSHKTPLKTSEAWFEKAHNVDRFSIGRWQQPEFKDRVAELYNIPSSVELLKYYGYAV